MKILPNLKIVGVALLTMGIAVGCATQPEVSKPAATKAAVDTSAADAAIADAKAALAKATALGNVWRDTGKMLKKAEKLAKAGKVDAAVKLANKAKEQANLAVEQYYKEEGMDRSLPSADNGAQATTGYTVARGDSLWRISGKSDVYGNPYEWPLIYKANSDKIKDADLIYPGQVFDINANPGADEVDAAIRHAKTRGAWSLGVAEASDKAYLAR